MHPVFLVQSKEKFRQHQEHHACRRIAGSQRIAHEKIERNPNSCRETHTHKLAFRQVQKDLVFHFGKVFGYRYIGHLSPEQHDRRRETALSAVFSFHWIFPDLVTAKDLFGQTSRFEQREAKNHRVGHRAEQRRVNIRRYPDATDKGCIDCHADHHLPT